MRNMLERRGGGFEWSSEHNSHFEPSKFVLMDFSLNRLKERSPMTIQGAIINPSRTHKFLGVILDQELRWKEHTAYAIAKGAQYVMLIRRLSRSAQGIPTKLIHQLYRAVAIPCTLYVASVWLWPTYDEKTNSPIRGSIGVTKKIKPMHLLRPSYMATRGWKSAEYDRPADRGPWMSCYRFVWVG